MGPAFGAIRDPTQPQPPPLLCTRCDVHPGQRAMPRHSTCTHIRLNRGGSHQCHGPVFRPFGTSVDSGVSTRHEGLLPQLCLLHRWFAHEGRQGNWTPSSHRNPSPVGGVRWVPCSLAMLVVVRGWTVLSRASVASSASLRTTGHPFHRPGSRWLTPMPPVSPPSAWSWATAMNPVALAHLPPQPSPRQRGCVPQCPGGLQQGTPILGYGSGFVFVVSAIRAVGRGPSHVFVVSLL